MMLKMRLLRHYYTASRCRGGFYTLACSVQLSAEFVQNILVKKGLINYSKPIKMEEPADWPDLSRYPVAIRFFFDDSKRIFSKIHYTGRSNHTPNRFGNFFADTLITVDTEEIDNFGATPYSILKSDAIEWKSRLTFEEDRGFPEAIPEFEISFPQNSLQLNIEDIIDFFLREKRDQRLLTLSFLLDMVVQEALHRPRRKIVIFGNESELVEWMLIVTSLFPSKLINVLTFTTYIDNPELSPFFMNGVIPECNVSPAALASKEDRYKVVELPFQDKNLSAIKNIYVELICDFIREEKINLIIDLLSEDYDLFKVVQLDASINRVAKFYAIIAKISVQHEYLYFQAILNEFTTLRKELEEEGIDISSKEEVIFEKTAETHSESLDSYYKDQVIWTSDQSICDSAFELYRNGYLHYLNNPSKSEQASNYIDFPNQFLNYVLDQAERRSKAGDNHNLENLSWELLQKFDQYINRLPQDLLRRICVMAVNLLDYDKECKYDREQIFNKLKNLNDLHKLQLENEFAFTSYQLIGNATVAADRDAQEYWGSVKQLCIKFKTIINEKTNYIARFLRPLFKKKLEDISTHELIIFLHSTIEIDDNQAVRMYLYLNEGQPALQDLTISFRKIIMAYNELRGQIIGEKEINVSQVFDNLFEDANMKKTIDLLEFKEMLGYYKEFWISQNLDAIFSRIK